MGRIRQYDTISERDKASYLRNKAQKLKHKKRLKDTLEGRLKYCLNQCSGRAKRKGFPCTLNLEFLLALYKKQKGLCALSKKILEFAAGDNNIVNPFVLSVDRIDSDKGYVEDNVQLVCAAVNIIKHRFNEAEFKFWIRAISREAFNDS